MPENHMTLADQNAQQAKDIAASPYPWRNDAIAEIERYGHWADLAGFERWLSRQDDLLDSAYAELDLQTKVALCLAFKAACEFAKKS